MPVSIQRFNQHGRRHPNDRIIFIKALPGPDYDTANDFLHRIAAICVPIMKANSLSVMTLEEHEPNREFVGRNFNSGEVIQLVLKAPSTGKFLPFRYVQMVMMHELAHCKQMNHSRAFWAVRNAYAGELRELWSKNYTGEGLWGRGRPLYADQYDEAAMPDPSNMFENLCGGTYRSRGRKRKQRTAKPELTYAEKKKRRIEKKFGVNGQELGGDEELRTAFEKGKSGPKPRVAGSNRGRELRLQAMLFRAEQQKAEDTSREQEQSASDDETDEASEEESEFDGELDHAVKALDRDGNAILDDKGHPMVRLRESSDNSSKSDAQSEWSELGHIPSGPLNKQLPMPPILEELQDEVPIKGRPPWATIPIERLNEGEESGEKTHEREDPQIERASSRRSSGTASRRGNKASMEKTAKAVSRSAGVTVPPQKNTSTSESTDMKVAPREDTAPAESTDVKGAPREDTAPSEFSRLISPAEAPSKPLPSLRIPGRLCAAASSTESGDHSDGTHPHSESTENDRATTALATTMDASETETLSMRDCAACSLANSPDALVCVACGNVLDVIRLPRYWRCKSEACAGSVYINTADAGRCGVCSAAKPEQA